MPTPSFVTYPTLDCCLLVYLGTSMLYFVRDHCVLESPLSVYPLTRILKRNKLCTEEVGKYAGSHWTCTVQGCCPDHCEARLA